MDTVTLGRTGLEVSVAGLGCGGHSRLGMANGASEEEAADIVRLALDHGVTFVDTARAYGTEAAVGRALEGRRDEVVVSTKALPTGRGGEPLSAADLRESIHKSLRRLRTDRVEIFHLHGVGTEDLEHCAEVLVPALEEARAAGEIRHLAISEQFNADPGHEALPVALAGDAYDVTMVGFNLLNPSARDRVFPITRERGVGVLVMFAVRRALHDPAALREVVGQLVEQGRVPADVDRDDPLGFLLTEGDATSVMDAAYRFARHEPGTDVVLFGTGNADHLVENLASLERGPLPAVHQARLGELFGAVDTVTAE